MSDPILCPECGHDVDGHSRSLACVDCWCEGVAADETCWERPTDIGRSYAEERMRAAWQDGYRSALLLTGPESSVAVEAAARALNLEGWTCFVGGHEPGHYGDCELCRCLCNDMARTALRAAQEVRSHD